MIQYFHKHEELDPQTKKMCIIYYECSKGYVMFGEHFDGEIIEYMS